MRGRKVMQPKIWYSFSLDNAVPLDDFYRKLEKAVDLSWVPDRVAGCYAEIGRPSIDPEVIVKIELIGYLEGITFERQLMRQVADRLSFRRYVGYDLDEPVPDHSTLSKARDLFGKELFQEVFDMSVRLCQKAGMVGGLHASVDRTLVEADAAMSSLEPRVVELTPQEHLERVFAQNPLEGQSPDNVVDLRERREELPRIGGAPEQGNSEPTQQVPAEGSDENVACDSPEAENSAMGDGDVDRDLVASEPAGVEVIVSGQTDDGIVVSRPADFGEVIAAEQTYAKADESRQVHVAINVTSGSDPSVAATPAPPDANEGAVASGPTSASAETGVPGKVDPAMRDKLSGDEHKRPNNFTHVSRTDPDARIASKPGVLPTLAYSAEYWTDSRHGVITHAAGFHATTPDHTTVIGGLSRQRSEFGMFLPSISADKGYGKGRLYRALNKANVVGYIPFQKRGNKALADGLYGIGKFKYDESRNEYECPGGHVLAYSGISVHWPNVSRVWAARKQDCRQCALRDKCTKSPGGRHLSQNIYQTEYEEMAERVQGPGSRLAAIARRTGPEPRFGEAKRWACMARAKYRGLDKFDGQVLFTAAAQNIKKFVKWTWRKGQGAGLKRAEGQQVADSAAGVKSEQKPSGERAFFCRFCPNI